MLSGYQPQLGYLWYYAGGIAIPWKEHVLLAVSSPRSTAQYHAWRTADGIGPNACQYEWLKYDVILLERCSIGKLAEAKHFTDYRCISDLDHFSM